MRIEKILCDVLDLVKKPYVLGILRVTLKVRCPPVCLGVLLSLKGYVLSVCLGPFCAEVDKFFLPFSREVQKVLMGAYILCVVSL